MAYLASLIYGYRLVENDGSALPQRSTLNFTGTGVTATDNPSLGTTDVTITAGGSGSGITDLVADVAASGPGVSTATVQGFRGRTVASTAPSDGGLYVYASPTSTWNPVVMTGDARMDRTGAVTVVGLQGYPVSTAAPVSGYALTWDAGNGWWKPSPNGGGSGGITQLTGDVTAGPGTGSQAATIANGAITNAKVAAGAAIAGTKISPNFGAQNILTTGYIGIGSTVASAGDIRTAAAFTIQCANGSGGSRKLLEVSSAQLFLGDQTTITAARLWGSSTSGLAVSGNSDYAIVTSGAGLAVYSGGANRLVANATSVAVSVPIVGDGTAWGSVNAVATQAMADANQTLAAAKYQCTRIITTGAITADRDLVFPTATDAQGCFKLISNQCTSGGPYGIVVKSGALAATVTVALNKTAIVWIDSSGVTRITADA